MDRLLGMRTNDAYELRYSLDAPPPSRLGVARDLVDEMRVAAAFYGVEFEDDAAGADPRFAISYDDAVARLFAFQERSATDAHDD